MNRRDFLKAVAALMGSYYVFDTLPSHAQTPGQGQRFFIPPTILHTTEETAMVYFRLSEYTENGFLIISQGDQEVQRIPLLRDQLRQKMTITNLEPATTYSYQVEVDGLIPPLLDFPEAWESLSFRTQPYTYPIRFAALGDSGFGDSVTQQLAAHIAAHNVDFFIHLGDIVYWSYQYNNDLWTNWAHKYYRPFYETLRHVPHYPTVGNHDREATTLLDGWSFYYWAFPPLNDNEAYNNRRQWYSFTINDIQFLSLNTQCFFSEPGRREQNTWLDERLADNRFRLTIPFFHIPFWTSGAVHQWDGLYAAEEWHPKFSAYAEKLGPIMSGHSHVYERIMRDNVSYVTSGGGSSTIYNLGSQVEGSQALFSLSHYLLGEIYEHEIVLIAYDINNVELDRATWEY